jgi:hypothetical protein
MPVILMTVANLAFTENLKNIPTIIVNEDGSASEKVIFDFKENVTKSDYFVFARISDVSVYSGETQLDCVVQRDIGSLIVCDNITLSSITYEFKTNEYVRPMNEFYVFKYKFPVTQVTDKFSVKVKLPLGSVIAEKSKLLNTTLRPFEPSYGIEGTDGRQIYIKWDLTNPKLGETIDSAIIFEKIGAPALAIVGVSIVLVVIAAIIFIVIFLKKSYRQILPVLTDSERAIMNIVIRNKKINQKKIVQETDFSKAKVSRIIKNLEERGLVRRISEGRTNIVMLSEKKTEKQGIQPRQTSK